MPNVNYIKGRLSGVQGLVETLKEVVEKNGAESDVVLKTMVDHISTELSEVMRSIEDQDNTE